MTLVMDHGRVPLDGSETRFARSSMIAGLRTAFAVLSRCATRIADGYRKRRAINDLLALDDRILRDIGVSRCEIPHLVNGRRLW